MTAFPLAANIAAARAPDVRCARTEDEARALCGGPVFLAVEELDQAFDSADAAEAAAPELYGSGLYELYWRDGAWRVSMRFWRPAPPAPVARTAAAAVKAPLGRARTPDEARAVLGAPAELASETLAKLYVDHKRLKKQWGPLIAHGLAEIVEREGKFAVAVNYWRPATHAAPLSDAERDELAQRIAAPMRGALPQAPLDIGLFERLAPENPDIVLAEEGDGRFRGD
jgi:hypothetical protein